MSDEELRNSIVQIVREVLYRAADGGEDADSEITTEAAYIMADNVMALISGNIQEAEKRGITKAFNAIEDVGGRTDLFETPEQLIEYIVAKLNKEKGTE